MNYCMYNFVNGGTKEEWPTFVAFKVTNNTTQTTSDAIM